MAVAPPTFSTCHVAAPPVGLVEVSTSPVPQADTHSETVGHEMLVTRVVCFVTTTVFQALDPPVGSVVLTTSPPISVATHNETVGHEMLERALAVVVPTAGALLVSMTAWCHVPAPPVGSVEL